MGREQLGMGNDLTEVSTYVLAGNSIRFSVYTCQRKQMIKVAAD
jgi:hypothetical protein